MFQHSPSTVAVFINTVSTKKNLHKRLHQLCAVPGSPRNPPRLGSGIIVMPQGQASLAAVMPRGGAWQSLGDVPRGGGGDSDLVTVNTNENIVFLLS